MIRRTPYALLVPWGVGAIVWWIVPAVLSLGLSFTDASGEVGRSPMRWVGGKNYRDALSIRSGVPVGEDDPWLSTVLRGKATDVRFARSIGNILCFTALSVPLTLGAALGAALLLCRPFRGAGFVRAVVYLPHLLGGVCTLIIWSWFLNPQFGPVNVSLRVIYLLVTPLASVLDLGDPIRWPVPGWLYSPLWCKPAAALTHLWTFGGTMMILIAAMRMIPQRTYYAASLDGAGRWARFRHVTWPHVSPAMCFCAVVSIIFSMQSFNESYLLENRQQRDELLFFMVYAFEAAFQTPQRLGYSCAVTWIFVGLLALIVAPFLLIVRRWVFDAVKDPVR